SIGASPASEPDPDPTGASGQLGAARRAAAIGAAGSGLGGGVSPHAAITHRHDTARSGLMIPLSQQRAAPRCYSRATSVGDCGLDPRSMPSTSIAEIVNACGSSASRSYDARSSTPACQPGPCSGSHATDAAIAGPHEPWSTANGFRSSYGIASSCATPAPTPS